MKSPFFFSCIGFLLVVFYPTSFPNPPYLAIKEEKPQKSDEESSEKTEEKPNEYFFNVWEWLGNFDFPTLDIDYSPSWSDAPETNSTPLEASPWDDPSLQEWVDLADK